MCAEELETGNAKTRFIATHQVDGRGPWIWSDLLHGCAVADCNRKLTDSWNGQYSRHHQGCDWRGPSERDGCRPSGEVVREMLNKWNRTTSQIDGFIDFDKTTRTPPTRRCTCPPTTMATTSTRATSVTKPWATLSISDCLRNKFYSRRFQWQSSACFFSPLSPNTSS